MYRFNRLMAECRATTKKNDKIEALTKLGANEDEFAKKMLVAALSPFVTYGVKDCDMPSIFNDADVDEGEEFIQLLLSLSTRQKTGNAAKVAIVQTLTQYTAETAENLACVLRKNLRVGIGATEINKVFPKLIPVFDVMLAEKYGDHTPTFPAQIEFKMDGQRTPIFVYPGQPVTGYSRDGLDQTYWIGGLFDEELQRLRQELVGDQAMVIDGEVMIHVVDPTKKHPSWSATSKSKKEGADRSQLKFYAYDFLTMVEWDQQVCLRPQFERSSALDIALEKVSAEEGPEGLEWNGRLRPSYKQIVNNREEAKAFFDLALLQGFEGFMLKDLNAPYVWDRSPFWLKGKPLDTAEGRIVAAYNGKKKGKYEHALGGFTVEGTLEDGSTFWVDVGGGYTDAQRHEFWAKREEMMGWVLECEYMEKTSEGSLRNPVFVRFRTDKVV
jgi:ATP-dependent DNA ligase